MAPYSQRSYCKLIHDVWEVTAGSGLVAKPESTDAGFLGGLGVLWGRLEAAWRCAEGVIATA
jgi:hypothetical protein